MKKFLLALSLIALLALTVYGIQASRVDAGVSVDQVQAQRVRISTDWKRASLVMSAINQSYGYNDENIAVAILDDEVVPVEMERRALSGEMECDEGVFVGRYGGEWGGNIRFESKEGYSYQILEDNFRGFTTIGEKYYVLTGLAHMGTDYGAFYEFVFEEGIWQAKQVGDLGSCPNTFLLIDNKLYIVTNKAMFVFDAEKDRVSTLVESTLWENMYPNSMLYANRSIYIGMRGGMFVYNLDWKTQKWYVLKEGE